MFLESNQAQRIFGDELIRKTDLPIKQYNTGAEKHALDRGVPSLKLLLENGKMRIPRGDKNSRDLTDIWMDEMHNFTFQNGRVLSVGAHDDTVMACIAPGARVTTIRGSLPIEDIETGDLVLTHTGRWQRVTRTMSRQYDGDALILRVSGGLPFIITPEHPVLRALPKFDGVGGTNRMTPNKDTWDFVPASDLRFGRKKLGDYVLAPKPIWPPDQQAIDLADYVSFARHARGGNCWKQSDTHIWWRADRKVPRYLKIDAELCFVIGLFLAEGSVGGGGGLRSSKKHCVSFGLHTKEHYIADYLGQFFDSRFKAISRQNISPVCPNSMSFSAASVPAAQFFAAMGKSSTKAMPIRFMGWPIELRQWIVRGWLVGDGALNQTKNGTLIRGVSISRPLLDQMFWTLQDTGLHPTLSPFRQSDTEFCTSRHSTYQLSLTTHDTRELLRDMNAVEAQRWQKVAFPATKPFTNRRGQQTLHAWRNA